jgi:putative thioredoxin
MTSHNDAFGPGAVAGSPDAAAHPAGMPTHDIPREPGTLPPQSNPFVVDATDNTFSDYIELSKTVPVIVDLWATWCEPCKQLSPILERVVAEYAGRMMLVKVDVDANPQLAQAFQAQSIPTIVALIGGKTAPLFQGALPEAQVREVLAQVLDVAAENGVTGSVDASAEPAEAAEVPLSPEHQDAFDAIERGDYAAATAAYEKALTIDPKDVLAEAGLAQVGLLARLAGTDAATIRAAAGANGTDTAAALAVADLDVVGGHVDDAFDRLLTLFPNGDDDAKNEIRLRLLELFAVVGVADPRVVSARLRLTNLLF